MEGLEFQDESWLALLVLVPFAFALIVVEVWSRRRAMRSLYGAGLIDALGGRPGMGGRVLRAAVACVAAVCVAAAMARPRVPGERATVQTEGRDVVFLVDVSRSMLATDLRPNRLERAKLWIKDVLVAGEGDRFALVAFAGDSTVVAPLTADTDYLALAVEELSITSAGRGGTNLGDAVRRTVEDVFEDETSGLRDIILITDGEDQGSLPVEAAADAAEQGARIIAIGIGDPNEGTPIPAREGASEFVTFNGEIVRSTLDAETLRRMAAASEGAFYNVATDTIDLAGVYRELVRTGERRQLEEAEVVQFVELFQWPLGAAAVLLLLELLVWDRSRRRPA